MFYHKLMLRPSNVTSIIVSLIHLDMQTGGISSLIYFPTELRGQVNEKTYFAGLKRQLYVCTLEYDFNIIIKRYYTRG